jgi:serine/threonine protein kinase
VVYHQVNRLKQNNMQSDSENTSTGNWRAAFAHAEALEGQTREAQREAIARLGMEDGVLARRVELMLGGDTTSGAVDAAVTKVLGNARVKSESNLKADDKIGAYTLVRPLGKGGMADVWLAQRTDGTLKRPVALKLPMALMPSPMLAERFARERDMLAQLDHPNIARIYDTGTTAGGQPFLALEFVDGEGLDHYCRETRATINARVTLVMQVAQAVHHAHSRLVLHRDLKPSNILVTREGVVKVLDFGIAKLLSEERTAEETQFTRMTGAALTPKYAAPEQLLSETVTTSTDVYAIAVVLYELLAVCVPFADQAKDLSARMATLNNPCRLLSENAISAPQINALNASSERAVKRALAGDLTAILDKALRRVPNDRYPSALAFADDLHRYLTNRPVLARQGAATYRVRKFFIRHRVPVAVALMGTLAAASLGLQAFTQSQRAAQSQQRADSIDGLMESLFQGMSPDVAAKRTFTAKELLDRASGYLGSIPNIDSKRVGTINSRMAVLYRNVGAYKESIATFEKLLSNAKESGDKVAQIDAHIEIADSSTKAYELGAAQKHIEAAEMLLPLIDSKMNDFGAKVANVEGQLAIFKQDYDRASERYAAAERDLLANKSTNYRQILWAIEGQGFSARFRGDLRKAREKFSEVIELDNRYDVRREIPRLRTKVSLASVSFYEGNFVESEKLLHEPCKELAIRLGATSLDATNACLTEIYSQIRLGKWEKVDLGLESLRKANQPVDDVLAIRIGQVEATANLYRGRAHLSDEPLQKSLELSQKEAGGADKNSDSTLRVRRLLAESQMRQGNFDLGCAQAREVENLQIKLRTDAHADVAITRVLLTACAIFENDLSTATQTIKKALAVLEIERGNRHQFTLAALAYTTWLDGGGHDAAKIATRIRSELGWQTGSEALAKAIENRERHFGSKNIPILL